MKSCWPKVVGHEVERKTSPCSFLMVMGCALSIPASREGGLGVLLAGGGATEAVVVEPNEALRDQDPEFVLGLARGIRESRCCSALGYDNVLGRGGSLLRFDCGGYVEVCLELYEVEPD